MARTTDADARTASAAPAASSAVLSPSNADLAASVAQLRREVRLLGAAVIVLGTFLLLDVRIIDGSRAGSTSSSAPAARAPVAPPRPLGNPQPIQIEHTPASPSGQGPPPSAAVAAAAGPQHRVDDDTPPTPSIAPTPAAPPLASDWLPPLPESTCPQPNGPNKNYSFWKSLPQYPKFLAHHDKMVEKLVALNGGAMAQDAGTELFRLYEEILNELVRPNPAVEFDSNPLHGNSRVLPFAHGIHAFDAWKAKGPALFQSRSLQGCRTCSFSGQRMHNLIMHYVASGNTRAAKDPSFKPRYFIDLGSRDYEDRMEPTDGMDRVRNVPARWYGPSTRFMEAHYPGFDKMGVLAIDADPKYAAGYKKLIQKRPNVPTTFWAAAGWVHDDGLGFRQSDMISEAVDGCWPQQDGAKCRCSPTVNMTRIILGLPPGDVALKIDVEFAEWVLLEHWLRAGVFNRVKEVFFECHSLYRLGGETIFPKPPALNGFLRDLYERLVGVLDCYLAHDLMRAEGVVTHNWP